MPGRPIVGLPLIVALHDGRSASVWLNGVVIGPVPIGDLPVCGSTLGSPMTIATTICSGGFTDVRNWK